MSKVGGILVVVLSLIAGFGGGWSYQVVGGGQKAVTSTEKAATKTASTQTLEECLKGVWGEDKYAAISANSSLATTEDNFLALQCYQSK